MTYWLLLTATLYLIHGCASTPPPHKAKPHDGKDVSRKSIAPYEVFGKRYYPISSSTGFVQRGLASWYGTKFHGRLTSNGERYNMYGRTAAHKTLPFNTYVQVTNSKNGRKTIVRINDRGPFVRGRIIDLTHTAANELGMVEDGVAPVIIEALGYARKRSEAGQLVREYVQPASYEVGEFTIQLGAFTEKQNALRLCAALNRKYSNASIHVFDQGTQRFYRVRVGQYSHLYKAEAAANRLQEQGFPNAFAVARDN